MNATDLRHRQADVSPTASSRIFSGSRLVEVPHLKGPAHEAAASLGLVREQLHLVDAYIRARVGESRVVKPNPRKLAVQNRRRDDVSQRQAGARVEGERTPDVGRTAEGERLRFRIAPIEGAAAIACYPQKSDWSRTRCRRCAPKPHGVRRQSVVEPERDRLELGRAQPPRDRRSSQSPRGSDWPGSRWRSGIGSRSCTRSCRRSCRSTHRRRSSSRLIRAPTSSRTQWPPRRRRHPSVKVEKDDGVVGESRQVELHDLGLAQCLVEDRETTQASAQEESHLGGALTRETSSLFAPTVKSQTLVRFNPAVNE